MLTPNTMNEIMTTTMEPATLGGGATGSKRRRRVRVSESPPDTYRPPPALDYGVDPSDLWFSIADIDRIKERASEQVRRMMLARHSSQTAGEDDSTRPMDCVLPLHEGTTDDVRGTGSEEVMKGPPVNNVDDERDCERNEDIDPLCTRGLEYRACLLRQRERHMAIRAVLLAQKRLREHVVVDGRAVSSPPQAEASSLSPPLMSAEDAAQFLAKISRTCTRRAREEGRAAGRADLRDAHDVYSQCCRSTSFVAGGCAALGRRKREDAACDVGREEAANCRKKICRY
mmetsp:Transcript_23852/g.44070  ORF Transcript_23852/g.44070 Transcript_23852/m.44070 type:complete len:286 (-) Transcript_23852:181-1038(-)